MAVSMDVRRRRRRRRLECAGGWKGCVALGGNPIGEEHIADALKLSVAGATGARVEQQCLHLAGQFIFKPETAELAIVNDAVSHWLSSYCRDNPRLRRGGDSDNIACGMT